MPWNQSTVIHCVDPLKRKTVEIPEDRFAPSLCDNGSGGILRSQKSILPCRLKKTLVLKTLISSMNIFSTNGKKMSINLLTRLTIYRQQPFRPFGQ